MYVSTVRAMAPIERPAPVLSRMMRIAIWPGVREPPSWETGVRDEGPTVRSIEKVKREPWLIMVRIWFERTEIGSCEKVKKLSCQTLSEEGQGESRWDGFSEATLRVNQLSL